MAQVYYACERRKHPLLKFKWQKNENDEQQQAKNLKLLPCDDILSANVKCRHYFVL